MKKLLLVLALLLAPSAAFAQCNGVFPPFTFCGNATASPGIPGQVPQSSSVMPGGTNGQVQYNNAGVLGGLTNPQLTALCQQFSTTLSGCVPAGTGGGTSKFLRIDGTWSLPPSSGSTIIYYACTGSSDSTGADAALAAAQAAAPAGGTLRLSGNCSLSSALTPTSNVTIEGDGMNSTFLSMTTSTVNCLNFNPSGANKTLNVRDLTCTYGSLSSTGATGFQLGNNSFNHVSTTIERVGFTNATNPISMLNGIYYVLSNNNITNYYSNGIVVSNPLLPDSGTGKINDNFIFNFAPVFSPSYGILWLSGGGVIITGNQIVGNNGVYLHASLQTSEMTVSNNLIVGENGPTFGIAVDTISAAFTCSQSGTTLTVSSVTGTLIPASPGALGQTVRGANITGGLLDETIVSQLTGTTGGAGTYQMTASGSAASAACTSTFLLTEVIAIGNTLDGVGRALYVPQNTGGEFLYNLVFNSNGISSDFNSSVNQITVFNTKGFTIFGNIIKCNGTCTSARPLFVDSSASFGLIGQSANSEPGAWGATDLVNSTNTTNAAIAGGQTKTCGATIVVNNGIVTSC